MELAGSQFLAEGGNPEYPEKNPRSQIEINKILSPHAEPRIQTRVVEVGGVNDDHQIKVTPFRRLLYSIIDNRSNYKLNIIVHAYCSSYQVWNSSLNSQVSISILSFVYL